MKLLSKIQQELIAPKGQTNKFGGYKYRSCEDIMKAVKPLLGEGSLVVTDDIMLIGDRYYVKATATLGDGASNLSTTAYAREAENKKGMDAAQVTGAASSYARKYALNGLFCIDDTKDSDATNDGKGDTKPPKRTEKPEGPTEAEHEIIEQVCVLLQKDIGDDKIISRKNVGSIFLTFAGKYPADTKKVPAAAAYIISLGREKEWAEPKPKQTKKEKMGEVWVALEKMHEALLSEGEKKIDRNKFEKAYNKLSDPMKLDKPSSIALAIKLADVMVNVKDEKK